MTGRSYKELESRYQELERNLGSMRTCMERFRDLEVYVCKKEDSPCATHRAFQAALAISQQNTRYVWPNESEEEPLNQVLLDYTLLSHTQWSPFLSEEQVPKFLLNGRFQLIPPREKNKQLQTHDWAKWTCNGFFLYLERIAAYFILKCQCMKYQEHIEW